uniref:ANK_REP_REGION domain-containing protein n=1 Tax=Dracunculus medinensis TaxID=318479 RepID=A0A0N4U4E9_DRAME
LQDEALIRDDNHRLSLYYAAEKGDTTTLKRILEMDSSLIDIKDENGYTPLMVSSMCGNVDTMKMLLENGAQINHVDKEKHSAVHWAVVCGQLAALTVLLEKGANANIKDHQGAQPLHYATVMEDIPPERGEAILHILLKYGALVNGKDVDGRTPLHWASSNGNAAAIQSLIQAGGNQYELDRDRLTTLHCAASHGHVNILEMLIESSGESIVDWMDRNGDTALFYAVTLAHYECSKFLLMSNANPNHQDYRLQCPSHCAAAKGQLKILKLLKHYGASFEIQNRRGDIPLHEAIQAGSKDVVEWLLSLHPSTVNAANHEGRTGLHLSAASGDMELVVLLCTKGAEINPLMLYKGTLYTPLDLAAYKNHTLVVDYLNQRHRAKRADQIPEEQRIDSTTQLEESMQKGMKTNQRYAHEKAIFQELTHLKRVQIQYGKAKEPILVRSLIGNFCKMHELNPAYFKFQTFYAWEKFLYDQLSDQLKMIYLEERRRLMNAGRPGAWNTGKTR